MLTARRWNLPHAIPVNPGKEGSQIMKKCLAVVLLLALATGPVAASDRPGLSPDSELFKTVAAGEEVTDRMLLAYHLRG